MQRIDERSTVIQQRSAPGDGCSQLPQKNALCSSFVTKPCISNASEIEGANPGISTLGLALSLKQCPERLMVRKLLRLRSLLGAARTPLPGLRGGRVLIRVKDARQILELPSLVHDFLDARDLPRH